MKYLALLIFLLSLNARALEVADVFSFADTFECQDRFPHHSFCSAVEFKAWSESEREYVLELLSVMNVPAFETVLQIIKEKGIKKFHRVGYASSWHPNQAMRRVEFSRDNGKVLLWVNPVTKVVGFTDAFFKGTPFIDPYANMPRKQLNVVHEVMHVFDLALGYASNSEEYQKAVGWTWDGHDHVIEGIPFKEARARFQDIMHFLKEGDAAKTYALDREYGIELAVPTLYSLSNHQESFAETMTYALLDPTSVNYLPESVQNYVKSLLGAR